jgi:hypothetical protein
MKSIKIQMILAAITAILIGLVMLEVSHYISAHNVRYGEVPIPAPSVTQQIFVSSLWMGLAVLIALFITALAIATNQIKKRQHFKRMDKYNLAITTTTPPNPSTHRQSVSDFK